MEAVVRQNIEDSSLIPTGDRVLVAISGGADSTALLYALVRLGGRMGFSVAAAHFDHGIRPAAAQEAVQVARLCQRLGVICVFGVGDVPGYARAEKKGLEEAGRDMRYRFLRRAAQICKCSRIATAHHQQDQAETLLMRLARGTSVSGLRGIPVLNHPFIRPILTLNRLQVEEYLAHNSLSWVEDDSNADCHFTRNHVRHNLMPVFEKVHAQAQKHVAQLAQQVSVDEEYWEIEVERVLQHGYFEAEETRIPHTVLAALHPALRMRVVRAILSGVRGGLHGLERRHLEVVEALFLHPEPQVQFDLPGAWVARRYADVVFRHRAPQAERYDYLLCIDGPGEYCLPDGSAVEVVLRSRPGVESAYCVELDGCEVEWPLYVRRNAPGDRLKCVGMAGSKKLKSIFAERRLELEQRRLVPVLCSRAKEILWVMGVRRSRLWRCSPLAHKVVQIVFEPKYSKI